MASSKFVVDLEGFSLPAAIKNRIATEIRRVVMKELASLDLKGDLVVLPTSRAETDRPQGIACQIRPTGRRG
jgi:hypothetical protein